MANNTPSPSLRQLRSKEPLPLQPLLLQPVTLSPLSMPIMNLLPMNNPLPALNIPLPVQNHTANELADINQLLSNVQKPLNFGADLARMNSDDGSSTSTSTVVAAAAPPANNDDPFGEIRVEINKSSSEADDEDDEVECLDDKKAVTLHWCDICSGLFQTLADLNKHRETHDNEYVTCISCRGTYSKPKIRIFFKHLQRCLRNQLSRSKILRNYCCVFCRMEFHQFQEYNKHILVDHLSGGNLMTFVFCIFCGKGYRRRQKGTMCMEKHFTDCGVWCGIPKIGGRYQCLFCPNTAFQAKSEFLKHSISVHMMPDKVKSFSHSLKTPNRQILPKSASKKVEKKSSPDQTPLKRIIMSHIAKLSPPERLAFSNLTDTRGGWTTCYMCREKHEDNPTFLSLDIIAHVTECSVNNFLAEKLVCSECKMGHLADFKDIILHQLTHHIKVTPSVRLMHNMEKKQTHDRQIAMDLAKWQENFLLDHFIRRTYPELESKVNNRMECPFCDKFQFSKLDKTYLLHVYDCVPYSLIQRCKEPGCTEEEMFETERLYLEHVLIKHAGVKAPEDMKVITRFCKLIVAFDVKPVLTCPFCSQRFVLTRKNVNIVNHIQYCVKKYCEAENRNECPACSETYESPKDLSKHIFAHIPDRQVLLRYLETAAARKDPKLNMLRGAMKKSTMVEGTGFRVTSPVHHRKKRAAKDTDEESTSTTDLCSDLNNTFEPELNIKIESISSMAIDDMEIGVMQTYIAETDESSAEDEGDNLLTSTSRERSVTSPRPEVAVMDVAVPCSICGVEFDVATVSNARITEHVMTCAADVPSLDGHVTCDFCDENDKFESSEKLAIHALEFHMGIDLSSVMNSSTEENKNDADKNSKSPKTTTPTKENFTPYLPKRKNLIINGPKLYKAQDKRLIHSKQILSKTRRDVALRRTKQKEEVPEKSDQNKFIRCIFCKQMVRHYANSVIVHIVSCVRLEMDNDGNYRCPVCCEVERPLEDDTSMDSKSIFDSKRSLLVHALKHMNLLTTTWIRLIDSFVGLGSRTCRPCGRNFCTKDKLSKHQLVTGHRNKNNESSTPQFTESGDKISGNYPNERCNDVANELPKIISTEGRVRTATSSQDTEAASILVSSKSSNGLVTRASTASPDPKPGSSRSDPSQINRVGTLQDDVSSSDDEGDENGHICFECEESFAHPSYLFYHQKRECPFLTTPDETSEYMCLCATIIPYGDKQHEENCQKYKTSFLAEGSQNLLSMKCLICSKDFIIDSGTEIWNYTPLILHVCECALLQDKCDITNCAYCTDQPSHFLTEDEYVHHILSVHMNVTTHRKYDKGKLDPKKIQIRTILVGIAIRLFHSNDDVFNKNIICSTCNIRFVSKNIFLIHAKGCPQIRLAKAKCICGQVLYTDSMEKAFLHLNGCDQYLHSYRAVQHGVHSQLNLDQCTAYLCSCSRLFASLTSYYYHRHLYHRQV